MTLQNSPPLDPFGFDEEQELPRRDRWSRPLLIPAGGGDRQPYTRASSLSSMLADDTSLGLHAQNQIITGMAMRPDLVEMASTLPPLNDALTQKVLLTKEQRQRDAQTQKALAEIREAARAAAYDGGKARMGTARHNICEPGADTTFALASLMEDGKAFRQCIEDAGIEIIAAEVFTASDDLMVAGSFDYLLRVPNVGIIIGDLKTGSVNLNDGLKFSIQLSCYANSEVYDIYTDERAPLESLTGGEQINRDLGMIFHLAAGSASCVMYAVDLEVGLKAAKLATRVREARKIKEIMTPAAIMPGAVFA